MVSIGTDMFFVNIIITLNISEPMNLCHKSSINRKCFSQKISNNLRTDKLNAINLTPTYTFKNVIIRRRVYEKLCSGNVEVSEKRVKKSLKRETRKTSKGIFVTFFCGGFDFFLFINDSSFFS